MKYEDFLARKVLVADFHGVEVADQWPHLFGFQSDIVRWALRKGRAAVFADTGLGKTRMQLTWANHVPGKVLILAPLAVAPQTVREGKAIGVDVAYCRSPEQIGDSRIVITNYEMLDAFDVSEFEGVILDESSILKGWTGKTRTKLISLFAATPYRLCCTATPAPNDHMELGNHAEFLSYAKVAQRHLESVLVERLQGTLV